MRDSQTTGGLALHWVPVVDASGRTHLEARWSAEPSQHAPVHASHAA